MIRVDAPSADRGEGPGSVLVQATTETTDSIGLLEQTLSRKSLSNVAMLDIWNSQGKPDELEILTTDTLLYGGFFGRKATRTIDSSGVMLDRYFQPLSWKRG